MSIIKLVATVNVQDLPSGIKTKVFSVFSDCRSNDSYFYLDLDEYRNWGDEAEYGTYADYFSQNQADVMQWLCTQTTEPEVVVLFWW